MDPVTHAASGALAMLAMPQRPATRWALPLAAFAAASPDLDILAASGPLQTLLLHRGITHALAAAPLMGLLLAILARPLWRYDTRNAWSFGGVWAFMMLMVLLHIWLDALTTYGTLVWLPFSGERLRLNAVYIIDLLMTLPLLWGIWHGLRQEKKRAQAQGAIPFPFQDTASLTVSDGKPGVRLALFWSILLYPALALGCQIWHTQQMQASLAAQGRDIRQLVVLPDAFAPLFWRALYLEKLPARPRPGLADAARPPAAPGGQAGRAGGPHPGAGCPGPSPWSGRDPRGRALRPDDRPGPSVRGLPDFRPVPAAARHHAAARRPAHHGHARRQPVAAA